MAAVIASHVHGLGWLLPTVPLKLRITRVDSVATRHAAARGRAELFDVYWSDRILQEVVRNLVADGRAMDEQARRLTDAMAAAFDGVAVPQHAVARLEAAMINDPRDRHVLAAASGAQAVVTLNLHDFPVEAREPFAVEALHPDVFLLDLYHLDAQMVYEAAERQAAALRRPSMTLDELLDRLAVTVSDFAATLRHHE